MNKKFGFLIISQGHIKLISYYDADIGVIYEYAHQDLNKSKLPLLREIKRFYPAL